MKGGVGCLSSCWSYVHRIASPSQIHPYINRRERYSKPQAPVRGCSFRVSSHREVPTEPDACSQNSHSNSKRRRHQPAQSGRGRVPRDTGDIQLPNTHRPEWTAGCRARIVKHTDLVQGATGLGVGDYRAIVVPGRTRGGIRNELRSRTGRRCGTSRGWNGGDEGARR